jgi:histidine triad (HIT) family protein
MDCIFCSIAAGEIPADLIYANDDVVAFRDLDPQAPSHVLVIPRAHYQDIADVSMNAPELTAKLFAAASLVAEQEELDEGFRLVTNVGQDGGQSVWHVHIHVLGGRTLQWPPG